MKVQDLVNKIITMYPTTLSPNDNARMAYALGDYTREMKIKRLNPRKQAWVNVHGFRAELPNDMDLGGSLWVFACVCDKLYTIDIINHRCPSWVKPQKLCECGEPSPTACDCGCSEIKTTCCGGCGGTIGYLLGGNNFGVYTSGYGWTGNYVASTPPFGHALLGNPFGNVSQVGNQLIFDTCFPCDGVYIEYEQVLTATNTPIDDIYALDIEYFTLSRLLKDTDKALSASYYQDHLIELDNIKNMKFLNAINPDTLARAVLSGFGLNKSP